MQTFPNQYSFLANHGYIAQATAHHEVLHVPTRHKGQIAKVVCGPLQVLFMKVKNNIFRAYLNNENRKWLATEQIPHKSCPTIPALQL